MLRSLEYNLAKCFYELEKDMLKKSQVQKITRVYWHFFLYKGKLPVQVADQHYVFNWIVKVYEGALGIWNDSTLEWTTGPLLADIL